MLLRGALGLLWKDILLFRQSIYLPIIYCSKFPPCPPRGLSKPCVEASTADRMRHSGKQAGNQKKRNSRSETDSTRVSRALFPDTAWPYERLSAHRFWLVWRMVSISFHAGYFEADLQYTANIQEREFPKDGFWLCALFQQSKHMMWTTALLCTPPRTVVTMLAGSEMHGKVTRRTVGSRGMVKWMTFHCLF